MNWLYGWCLIFFSFPQRLQIYQLGPKILAKGIFDVALLHQSHHGHADRTVLLHEQIAKGADFAARNDALPWCAHAAVRVEVRGDFPPSDGTPAPHAEQFFHAFGQLAIAVCDPNRQLQYFQFLSRGQAVARLEQLRHVVLATFDAARAIADANHPAWLTSRRRRQTEQLVQQLLGLTRFGYTAAKYLASHEDTVTASNFVRQSRELNRAALFFPGGDMCCAELRQTFVALLADVFLHRQVRGVAAERSLYQIPADRFFLHDVVEDARPRRDLSSLVPRQQDAEHLGDSASEDEEAEPEGPGRWGVRDMGSMAYRGTHVLVPPRNQPARQCKDNARAAMARAEHDHEHEPLAPPSSSVGADARAARPAPAAAAASAAVAEEARPAPPHAAARAPPPPAPQSTSVGANARAARPAPAVAAASAAVAEEAAPAPTHAAARTHPPDDVAPLHFSFIDLDVSMLFSPPRRRNSAALPAEDVHLLSRASSKRQKLRGAGTGTGGGRP